MFPVSVFFDFRVLSGFPVLSWMLAFFCLFGYYFAFCLSVCWGVGFVVSGGFWMSLWFLDVLWFFGCLISRCFGFLLLCLRS